MKFSVFFFVLFVLSLGACKRSSSRGTLLYDALPTDLGARAAAESARKGLTKFDGSIIDSHAQLYEMSCIPSSVEMVLKLLGRVPASDYDLQNEWKNKSDGSFQNFDGKSVNGVTFHLQFWLPRNDDFPLEKLFAAIHSELKEGRFVIAGLASGGGWHNWVIYDEDSNGEFLAVSKFAGKTIREKHVKAVIARMKGTDIGTYELQTPAL